MFIEEVCMEGFKSYAQRTLVTDFDPKFNAITGLNGSGKSNILDSICFVLGITNLQQVRAGSLQELVYKQGQAGVSKATVSVTFNNSDRKNSPLGYEDCKHISVTRQIVIGGRNKYLINGHIAQPSRVQNLFHSVQLNVNNPHFLIMQGRITKVLNMKPPEILSMLEEAAGTRMYEMKKEGALKTLDKKQTKVDEIDRVLSEEILPALQKLRKERLQYQQWAQGNADLDKLRRFVVAFEYTEAEKLKKSAGQDLEGVAKRISEVEKSLKEGELEMQERSGLIEKLTADKEKEVGPAMRKLVEVVDGFSKDLVKETVTWSNQKDLLSADKASLEQLRINMSELDETISKKAFDIQHALRHVEAGRQSVDEAAKVITDAEAEFQRVQAGKFGGPGEKKSLAEKLSAAKESLVESSTAAKQAALKIAHLEKEVDGKKRLLEGKKEEAMAVHEEKIKRGEDVKRCQGALEKLQFDEVRMSQLEETKRQKSASVSQLQSKISEMEDGLNVGFTFTDPTKNFDRMKVKGVVAKLVTLKDVSAATALEVVAGAKLFNVVVDSEHTGKVLLEKGGLRRRVTLIPLNRIQSRTIPDHVQAKAAKLVGSENVSTALSLVQYDQTLTPAVSFVFGSHFVCKSSAVAQKLAFHPEIMTPCVTLDGDLFSPSGLLTGGSRKNGGSVLSKIHVLRDLEKSLCEDEQLLQKTLQELETMLKTETQYKHLKAQLELKLHQLHLLEDRIRQSEHHQLSEEITSMNSQLEASRKITEQAEARQRALLEEVLSLEASVQRFGREREQLLRQAEERVKEGKARLGELTKELQAKESHSQRLEMDREAAMKEKQTVLEQMESMQQQVKRMAEKVAELETKVAEKNAQFKAAESKLAENRAKLQSCDAEIGKLVREQGRLKETLAVLGVELKKLNNKLKLVETDASTAAKFVDDILKKCDWIRIEKQFFGQPGSDYDFASRGFQEAKETLKAKESEQSSAEKRVNKKVMNMFESAEQEYNDLLSKKSKVQNDKDKIEKVIVELDHKKREALQKTWLKVTKDFGSIFSTLLPGTMAKLDPPEGSDFMAGLEVKVAFGTVWKQSLSELSGGQRSLLALSLILSLLLFKPAPLYILDEVDAALDLSHTQNIGRMIKAHFPHSQFIVVSLKEGMFNNANVIFRTKFVDGVSAVTRTVPSGGRESGMEKRSQKAKPRSCEDRENVDPNVMLTN